MTDDWPVTWEANRREQVREIAALPVAERVRWLEEALEFARSTGALERSCRLRDEQVARLWAGES